MAELLFEVGCEEIPASWLEGLAVQLREAFSQRAAAERLEPSELHSAWTPRRLVLMGEVAERQPDAEERSWGPSLKVARAASGAWTKAAQGFARKHGVTPDALEQAAKDPASPDDLYLLRVVARPGRPAAEVLSDLLPACLRALSFPKRMNWDARIEDGHGAFPFGRPVRWLVALLDGRPVPLRIHVLGGDGEETVDAGAHTRGHRFLPRSAAGASPAVTGAGDYARLLEEHCVIVEPGERAVRIAAGLAQAARHGRLQSDDALVAEWRDLVEHPVVVVGRVPAEFQRLPSAVLRTVLVHHQKYLAIVDAGGAIGHFAAVTDADASSAERIAAGMERVVVARLRDAAFFYDEDRKRPLASRVADLAGVTFHRGLGSYAEKAERMAALVLAASPELLEAGEPEAAARAARLAKADLTTLMVGEFPELQGVMGGLYLSAGEESDADVAAAVGWHYHPISTEPGSAPQGVLAGRAERLFGVVSLADKLDTLAGYFDLDLAPTGSRDPFGLRRAGQGAVRLLLDFELAAPGKPRPGLRRWVAAAVEGHAARAKRDPAELSEALEAFLLERLRHALAARGHAADEIDAVLGARDPDALDDPREALLRAQALGRVRAEVPEDFEHLAVAFKRARNIAGDGAGEVDVDAFQEPAEGALHEAVQRLAKAEGSYEERLRALASLRAPVDRFFDDVLVMAEDARLRENRRALLMQTLALFYRVADISRLGG